MWQSIAGAFIEWSAVFRHFVTELEEGLDQRQKANIALAILRLLDNMYRQEAERAHTEHGVLSDEQHPVLAGVYYLFVRNIFGYCSCLSCGGPADSLSYSEGTRPAR